MKAILRTALAVAGVAIATQAVAQVTFYEREGFKGRSFTTEKQIGNFQRYGFNDRASSVTVLGDRWEVCENARFSGQCAVLRPGRYPSLAAMGLNDRVSSARALSRNARIDGDRYAPAPVAAPDRDANAQLIFYEGEDFQGRSFTTGRPIGNLKRYGFNDRASSVVVMSDRWEVCENPKFNGRCAVLRPGRYPSLAAMGLNDRVSSVRTVSRDAYIDDNRYAPAPVAEHDYRRRDNERLYQAKVTSVRAVVGPPEQRCWVEQEQVPQEKSKANVPGAIAGALIGGILGHQVGNGRGNDLATVGGAVAGAAVGANVGRSGGQAAATQDVKRCENVPSQARPDHWDVTYRFHGQEHRMQMATPPGSTVTVNEQGEPRA
ncbi:MAG TPA: beta/gamma crystallin-related protein [Rhodocyclaceae bacterium]|nr:beta/gamma crystallin-related protein [Rhodocyclaceae bacterium]